MALKFLNYGSPGNQPSSLTVCRKSHLINVKSRVIERGLCPFAITAVELLPEPRAQTTCYHKTHFHCSYCRRNSKGFRSSEPEAEEDQMHIPRHESQHRRSRLSFPGVVSGSLLRFLQLAISSFMEHSSWDTKHTYSSPKLLI